MTGQEDRESDDGLIFSFPSREGGWKRNHPSVGGSKLPRDSTSPRTCWKAALQRRRRRRVTNSRIQKHSPGSPVGLVICASEKDKDTGNVALGSTRWLRTVRLRTNGQEIVSSRSIDSWEYVVTTATTSFSHLLHSRYPPCRLPSRRLCRSLLQIVAASL